MVFALKMSLVIDMGPFVIGSEGAKLGCSGQPLDSLFRQNRE
jgi:hypothetical protein